MSIENQEGCYGICPICQKRIRWWQFAISCMPLYGPLVHNFCSYLEQRKKESKK